jgi:hypothetical protein
MLEQSSARLGSLPAADQTSPSAYVEREERPVRLANSLALLPEDQRRVVVALRLHDQHQVASGQLEPQAQFRAGVGRGRWPSRSINGIAPAIERGQVTKTARAAPN